MYLYNRSLVYLVLALLGLRCCMGFSLVVESGILIAVVSLVEHAP